jgi:hypothetical protein
VNQDELQHLIETHEYVTYLEKLHKRMRCGFELATLIAALMTILAIIGWTK